MIDWIDVNDRLPENGKPVKLKTIEDISRKKHIRGSSFYDNKSIFGVDTFCLKVASSGFYSKTKFKGLVKKGSMYILEEITHWAYINKPKEINNE